MDTNAKLERRLLHHTGKAIADFTLIEPNDRVMVCLSGGKDSYTLLTLLTRLRKKYRHDFELFAFTLDQQQPGWDDRAMRQWLENEKIAYEIVRQDTYSIVTDKVPSSKTYCSLCARLRRGIIYNYAEKNGFNKIALGHHREDLIETLLLSIFYNGSIQSMPPKLRTDDKRNIVIRPLVYCHEKDIIAYAKWKAYPIIPCNLCGSQENLKRKKIKDLITQLAQENDSIPSNLLAAISHIRPSQLMDTSLWDFTAFQTPSQ